MSSAASQIQTGDIVPVNLPLTDPEWPAFGRKQFEHSILTLVPNIAYDDTYNMNTQSGTQFDGFRHFSHIPTGQFYNGTTGEDIVGDKANTHKCSIHHWAEHGIAGRGVLIDYWGYAKKNGKEYDPYSYHAIGFDELFAAGKDQGIDIRPAAQGGDIQIGDLLFIRSGFVETYYSKEPEERKKLGLRKHGLGDVETEFAGVGQEDKVLDWLHDSYFAAVVGDAPSFEAWPPKTGKSSNNNRERITCVDRRQTITSINTFWHSGECRWVRCSTWKSFQRRVEKRRDGSSSSPLLQPMYQVCQTSAIKVEQAC